MLSNFLQPKYNIKFCSIQFKFNEANYMFHDIHYFYIKFIYIKVY